MKPEYANVHDPFATVITAWWITFQERSPDFAGNF